MAESPRPRYRRVLLKLSGEFLKGKGNFGLDVETIKWLARQIEPVREAGIELGIVIGGGNIFRGSQALHVERAGGDYIGMVATMINALMLQAALEEIGLTTRVMSGIEMRQVAEPYIRRRALRHLEKGRIVIFGGGTGNPFFTTDTAAALRANEIQAEILLKGTQVDGVYSDDPKTNSKARKLTEVDYATVLRDGLRVMDATAIAMCGETKLPILVFNLSKPGNILRVVRGERVGTLVRVKGGSPKHA
jgi:uridylate kinase